MGVVSRFSISLPQRAIFFLVLLSIALSFFTLRFTAKLHSSILIGGFGESRKVRWLRSTILPHSPMHSTRMSVEILMTNDER